MVGLLQLLTALTACGLLLIKNKETPIEHRLSIQVLFSLPARRWLKPFQGSGTKKTRLEAGERPQAAKKSPQVRKCTGETQVTKKVFSLE
ncbi:hypothetical protein Ddc_16964 [Ditylenchus destructor]|nr:hypothetical protein Ddc_16964 [Ditylenchus destructor]